MKKLKEWYEKKGVTQFVLGNLWKDEVAKILGYRPIVVTIWIAIAVALLFCSVKVQAGEIKDQ